MVKKICFRLKCSYNNKFITVPMYSFIKGHWECFECKNHACVLCRMKHGNYAYDLSVYVYPKRMRFAEAGFKAIRNSIMVVKNG